jgi:chaperonin GroEL
MTTLIQNQTFEVIQKAVNKAVDFIRPTFGPSAHKVVISKLTHRTIADDGVQIARDLEFDDPAENAVLNVVRETAIRTNDRVGDGTTCSLIMLQAIINEVAKLSNPDGRAIERELKKALEEATKQLITSRLDVNSLADINKVARISFDNNEIAKLIAETWFKLGRDGVITLDRSGTMDTIAELENGITIDRGYISPYMVTNVERGHGIIERPYILLTDMRLTETADIIEIMNKLAANKIVNLVLICDNLENSALATMILNKMQGKFNLIAVNIPSGDKDVILEDLGIALGARVFSEKKGDKLENAEIADLGRADRFIAKRTESLIVGPRGAKKEVSKAIESLKTLLEQTQIHEDREALRKRIAWYNHKVAVLKVGAATENEEKALRFKVEDAVNAVKSAYQGGVVCGSGLALYRLKTKSPILNAALKAPFQNLCYNIGIQPTEEFDTENYAKNFVTGKSGNFMDVGVVDPVEVLIAGIESAISIASLLITCRGLIVEPPQKPKQE